MRLVESRPGRPVLIRITPLIDVVFILLIFFMLTSRLTPLGAVEVSSAAPGGGSSAENDKPNLHLQAPDGLRWNGEPATRPEVLARLDQLRPDAVVISTDPDTPLTQFTRWQGLLSARGIIGQWRKNGEAGPDGQATGAGL
ncbi:MAG: biopolymer transporter ExbD [Alteromonadaceae bacterium]|nr:biopolymer transporter ExbD [Alteromonadaceae bacterium]|tara:strand:+ start:365 stop:787 length:423 start_codon:yes stop_codon:yes gene_type:complete